MRGTEKRIKVVVDTNVIVAGLRSRNGASNGIIQLLLSKHSPIQLQLSTPVLAQYRSLISRHAGRLTYTPAELAHIFAEVMAAAEFSRHFLSVAALAGRSGG